MNLFARSWGGILSDYLASKAGIRGRIWGMWIVQTLEGLMCIFLGCITLGMENEDSPTFYGADKVSGQWTDTSVLDAVTYTINGTAGKILPCGSNYMVAPKYVACPVQNADLTWGIDPTCITRLPVKGRITIIDPNPDCIHNGNTLGVTMVLIIVFSLFVQMAEGLHFGIVPFISRPALGVVSGMVGAGGNMGALISGQFIVGSGRKERLDQGFVWLGIVIICLSMSMHFIFFPGEGGMLLPKNFPYDPQWIKPPAGAQGSDQLNFDNVKKEGDKEATSTA
jgi:NNP family nitrate/nitrite transporter-like MFS transporter